MKVKNSLTPKSRKGTKNMQNVIKEQVMSIVEVYGKAVEREAYGKVQKLLHSKLEQLNKILDSQEAANIFAMAMGKRFDRLYVKRQEVRMKVCLLLDILQKVSELRYGMY